MKLLFITQKINKNDDDLAFVILWIKEFIKQGIEISVICLEKRDFDDSFPVYSLGKESGFGKMHRILTFFKYIFTLKYDAVFVHMNPIYVVLGGLLWRVLGKKIGLWYVHRSKTVSLWVAEKLVDIIFTSTKESFMIATNKSIYLGHGIDVESCTRPALYQEKRNECTLLCVGRLTPIKDQETIIRACGILAREGVDVICTFIGGPAMASDHTYIRKLQSLVESEGIKNKIFFKGGVAQKDLFPYYWKSAIHINACPTGGLDKVVIEGMAGGAIPLVANEAFRDIIGEYAERLIFSEKNAESLAKHIKDILGSGDKEKIRRILEKKVHDSFDLSILITKILHKYEASR